MNNKKIKKGDLVKLNHPSLDWNGDLAIVIFKVKKEMPEMPYKYKVMLIHPKYNLHKMFVLKSETEKLC